MAGITKDAAFPEETAQLFSLLNRCMDGQPMEAAVQAAGNLAATSINMCALAFEMSDEQRVLFREEVLANIRVVADRNWKRAPGAGDIPVRQQ